MKALVFASRDQPETFDSAERLVRLLNERGQVVARLIDKLTSKVEELLLMAEYGVVESTVVVLVDGAGLRARRSSALRDRDVGIPSREPR